MIRFAFAFGLLVSSNALAQNPPSDDPILCVDTLDCGGICGTEQEVNVFLAQCNGGPAGPCFDDCWSACNHANENSNNPNLSACTMECVTASCPANAAAQGLIQAGHTNECPVPAADAVCPLIYDPVDCGGCTYSNACFALAADLPGGTCQSINETPILEL